MGEQGRGEGGEWEKIPETISLLFSVLITDAPDASIFTYPRIVLRLPFNSPPSLPLPLPSPLRIPLIFLSVLLHISSNFLTFWQRTHSQNLFTDSIPLISVIPAVPCRVSSFGR